MELLILKGGLLRTVQDLMDELLVLGLHYGGGPGLEVGPMGGLGSLANLPSGSLLPGPWWGQALKGVLMLVAGTWRAI
jgi:hypothetical protein